MTWLYTLIFAGLTFSYGVGPTPAVNEPSAPPAAVVDETEHFDRTFPFNPNGRVNLSNLNGAVILDAWDRNEVRVEYTKTVDTKERLAQAQVNIDARPESLVINTEFHGWQENDGANGHNFGKLNIDFHLTIPRTAVLSNIEAVNGNVTISRFTNFSRVSVVNGTLTASDLRGTSKLSTVNGELRANIDKLESGSQISLETVMGSVTLIIPSDSSALIKANSLNGSITNDFGLPVRNGKYVGRDLYGRIGGGDVPVRLNSVNGSLAISRQKDGKPVGPVTNLLNMKGGEDTDADVDVDVDVDAPAGITKEINKAMKDSQKVMKDSVKKADEQMKDVAPKIADLNKLSKDLAKSALPELPNIDAEKLKMQIDMAQKAQWENLPKIYDWSFGTGLPSVDETSDSFPVQGTPKVTIEAPGCAVIVRSWDRKEVQYRAVQYSRAHPMPGSAVKGVRTDSGVTIRTDNPVGPAVRNSFFGSASPTRIEVFVPQNADVTINSTGEIRVEGVNGDLQISGGDQAVNVRDSSGTLKINSGVGRVRVIGFRGDVNTNTSEGDISLEGTFSSVVARSAEGDVILTLPSASNAEIETNSPEVKANGVNFEKVIKGDDTSKYRLGTGGAKFQLWTEGRIEIRSFDSIKAVI